MFAPPGYPKTTSTPSRNKHSHKISAPVFFINAPFGVRELAPVNTPASWLTPELTLQHRARICAGDEIRITFQPLGGDFGLKRRQCRQPALDLFIAQADIEPACRQIDHNYIPILERGDRTARRGFRGNVPDTGTARTAAEATIRDQGNLVAESLSHDRSRGRQHLLHPGS